MSLSETPEVFNSLKHYLKIAIEHDKRDPVVSYYCKYSQGYKIDVIDNL